MTISDPPMTNDAPAQASAEAARAYAIKAVYQFADCTARHWRNVGKGGSGFVDELDGTEQIAVDAIVALSRAAPSTRPAMDEKAMEAAVLAAPGTTSQECRAIAEPIVRAYLEALTAPAEMPGEAQQAHEDFLEVARIAEGWKSRALAAEAALAAERERCAKVADGWAAAAKREAALYPGLAKRYETEESAAEDIAAAIRAGK